MHADLIPLQKLVERARELGAGGAEALLEERDGVSIHAQAGQVGQPQHHRSSELTIRLWMPDGASGSHRGPMDEAETILNQALASAKRARPQPLGGPIDRFSPVGRGLGILDPRREQLTLEEREAVFHENIEEAAEEDPRVQLGSFEWADTLTTRSFVNTRGVSQQVRSTEYHVHAEVFFEDDPPIHLTDRLSGRTFVDVACLPWGPLLARRAKSLAGPRVDVEGAQRVLLPPRACARLIGWLADRFDHDTLTNDRTFLTRDGGASFSPRLHLLDDGTLSGGIRTRGFDDRGTLPMPLPLLREGRVAAHLLTPEQARALDLKPTGHVLDGRLQPSNLILNAGLRTINALLSDLGGHAVEVDDFPDLSGIDEATGDLDLPFDGFLRDASGHLGVIRQARLRGNLIEALQQVVGIASDTDRIGHIDASAIFLDGLRVEPG